MHLARLRFAQHFAGAADFEVMHRQIKARAQLFHRLDGFQAFFGIAGDVAFVGQQHVGVGLMMRAADAAAQLVQLGEAEAVGAVDDDGVGGRDVDAGFDDGRAQQDVEAALVEIAHRQFQLALAHLPVGNAYSRFRQQPRQFFLNIGDGVDVVVQEIHLAATLQFSQHRFADQRLGITRDKGLDRQSSLRRGGDHRKITQAFQRHRQRARNRRRGQRQHVDFRAHSLELLLLAHAEAVFFVDDDQAEVLELDVLADQLVRADGNVDAAFVEANQRLRGFFGGAKARELGDFYRPVGETVGEGIEMLFGEQCRRHQHGHLFAVGHRDKGGAQRDLGFAETDVAADQTIHRFGAF